ncbi:hypothetical protein [Sporosarcina sp. P33]|nr:hypothetical protein [Sporosarcina sp. P33]
MKMGYERLTRLIERLNGTYERVGMSYKRLARLIERLNGAYGRSAWAMSG